MPRRRHPYHQYKRLCHLISPLWIADLLDIFNIKTPTELHRFLEGPRFKVTDYDKDPVGFSSVYLKYWKGEHLPDDERFDRLVAERGRVVVRALELPLWEILTFNGYQVPQSDFNATLYHLSIAVREAMFRKVPRARYSVERTTDLDKVTTQLGEIGGIDGLTALLFLLKEQELRVEPDEVYGVTEGIRIRAWLALSELLVFPPFFNVLEAFDRHFQEFVLIEGEQTDEFGEPIPREPYNYLHPDAVRYFREALEQAVALGVIGPSFQEQLSLLKVLRAFGDDVIDDIRKAFRSPGPYELHPSSRLWKFLKETRHPLTESGEIAALPGEPGLLHQTKVANALGPAAITSMAPADPTISGGKSAPRSRPVRQSPRPVPAIVPSRQRDQTGPVYADAETGQSDHRNRHKLTIKTGKRRSTDRW